MVPYSSKLRTSAPFSKRPVVDVTFSPPCKNEPLIAGPEPAISKRNGISTPSLTTTDASHNPLSDCAEARDGSAARPITAETNTTSAFLVIPYLMKKTKRPGKRCASRACETAVTCGLRSSYECTPPVDAASRRPEASPATQHARWQQQTTGILINGMIA